MLAFDLHDGIAIYNVPASISLLAHALRQLERELIVKGCEVL